MINTAGSKQVGFVTSGKKLLALEKKVGANKGSLLIQFFFRISGAYCSFLFS
jgi:hypothetical protein